MISFLHALYAWVLRHEAISFMVFSALVNAMPRELPPVRFLHEWLWEWQHDAAKLFMNYRSPAPPSLPAPQPAVYEPQGEMHVQQ